MTAEIWKDVPGYEGRYQVSNQGRVKSLPFLQRYLLRTGAPALRRTNERILSAQPINSGYLIVHLHLNNKREARLVHRLVAEAFLQKQGDEVNHKNGNKADNTSKNLEWCARSENHDHAVDLGLNTQAMKVRLIGGGCYPSISRAARQNHTSIGAIVRSARQKTCTATGQRWEFI